MPSLESQQIRAISENTIAAHGRKQEFNCLRNLPSIARSYGIKALRHKFKGVPCVVTGAGPSLESAMPLLREHQGKYILIATDRSLKPLLDAEILPHIVCASDMDPVLSKLFMGYRIPESIALLYDRDCFWELPHAWLGPKITYDTYFDVGIWEATFMGNKGFLCKNFTVSHTAIYVGQMLGCSPVILAGVDFAYPDAIEQHHVKGAVHVDDEADTLYRSHWVKMPGNVLPEVSTTEVFSIAIPAMTNQLKEIRVKTLNTSEIGAKIPGAEYQPLGDALKAYGVGGDWQDQMDRHLAADPPNYDHDAFDKQTAHVIKSMMRINDLCADGINMMDRLKKIDLHNLDERVEYLNIMSKWKSFEHRLNKLKLTRPKDKKDEIRLIAAREKYARRMNGIHALLTCDEPSIFMSDHQEWLHVFVKVNAFLLDIQKDLFSMYLTQRAMLASTKKTAEMLESVKHLPERDRGRMAMEANRHTVYFMSMGHVAKLFVDSLTAARQELIPKPALV